MFYQIALGGYKLEDTDTFDDAPNNWYEPGYSILFPLQVTIPRSDEVYFLVRERSNSEGTSFAAMDISDTTVTVTDPTTGANVQAELMYNDINENWTTLSPYVNPVVLKVVLKLGEDDLRVRSLEIVISSNSGEKFVTFRANVVDQTREFSCLTVYHDQREFRPTASKRSSNLLIRLTQAGSYTIISPSANFVEAGDTDDADFSYPTQQIFYQQGMNFNDEVYDWTIQSASHDALSNVVSVKRVPGCPSMAVLVIDAYAYTTLANTDEDLTLELQAESLSTPIGNRDTLSIQLVRDDQIVALD